MTYVFDRRGFLTETECGELCAEMERVPRSAGGVRDPDRPVADSLDDEDRRAYDCDVSDETRGMISERISRVAPEIAAYFGVALTEYEAPHFVRYEPGGFYRAHRDLYPDVELPEPLARRRVSVVVFLNDATSTPGFLGGTLRLGSHDADDYDDRAAVAITAERGRLVAFRADTWHEVTPVTEGTRATIVTLLLAPPS